MVATEFPYDKAEHFDLSSSRNQLSMMGKLGKRSTKPYHDQVKNELLDLVDKIRVLELYLALKTTSENKNQRKLKSPKPH